MAWKELRREGIVLGKKAVRRIAEQLGHQLLELRRRELFTWRRGWLPAGKDFAGRRVAVQIDGGRVRLRENKKRKKNGKKKKGRRKEGKDSVDSLFLSYFPFSVLPIFPITQLPQTMRKPNPGLQTSSLELLKIP